MDEQDTSQLNTVRKIINKNLQEAETQKASCENITESQLDGNSVVYEEPGAENEVITIVSNENDGEVYIYNRNEIESTPNQNPAEYIQVCDSSNAFDEVNNSEEKDINVDDVEEEEVERKKEKIEESQEKWETNEECSKEEGTPREESQSKNYKYVILEDWEVEVPQVIQNHGSQNYIETVVVDEDPSLVNAVDGVTHNNENCAVVELTDSEFAIANDHRKKNAESENANNKGNLVDLKKENSTEGRIENPKSQEAYSENMEGLKENSKEDCWSYVRNENSFNDQNENSSVKDGMMTPRLAEKRMEVLKYPKSVTKEEIVKILDDSSERVRRPIVGGKDLFFSIELTKRFNQKLSLTKGKTPDAGEKHNDSDSCNNNNTVDDRQKIVDILEADEIKDWKSIPSKSDLEPKENGNDMEISKAIKSMEKVDSDVKPVTKTPRKTPLKKSRTIDKELERMLALQQLREEFPSTRKRSRTSKKVNHVPFLASTVLEKAMTSPEVSTALKPEHPKRRPCYLPENVTYSKAKDAAEEEKEKEKEPGLRVKETKMSSSVVESDFEMSTQSIPNAVVKTYSAKRKSTDAESDIKTTLEAVAKALNESSGEALESKPKKQKTGTKESKNKILVKKKRKLKVGAKSEKKMKSELEKLLGDEGAVRMLYDTQHSGETSSTTPKKVKFKSTTGLKKDLVLKTKLVKNAVMRLSGVGADGVFLRGKRRSNVPEASVTAPEEEPLFSSTPNVVLYKPKKKQRAEASRILYRHSSSESFDSSEGYRRTSFDADGVKMEPVAVKTSGVPPEEWAPVIAEAEKVSVKVKKKLEAPKRGPKNVKEAGQKKARKGKAVAERLSTDSLSTNSAKLDLSNVPVRKSCRPRVVSKKYSVWSSTSMDSLSVESLGLKKLKKASTELGKKLNCKELTILQYEHLVQIVLTPTNTVLRNSLNYEVLQELLQVFSYLSKEESCRGVLVTSRGNTFCQGIDINRIIAFSEGERGKGVGQLVRAIRDFVTCLASFKKLVIAGVQGAAVGLGVTLLPYCDLIMSSDTASFYTPYVKLGQAPEGAPIHTFPNINRHLVSELLFKSRKLTAADAFKYGLVTQVIREERFESNLIMTSRNLASQPVQGMQSIKFLRWRNAQRSISDALEAEGELLENHWNSEECINNMIRFLNSGELQLKQNSTA